MLTLIESGFTSLGSYELITRVKNSVGTSRRTFLIVPEQETLTRERNMCDILPPESAKCFEVTNFTRFANTAFRTLGGISGEYCDSSVKSLIMWRTLTELSPLLKMTETNKEIGQGTVARAMAAITEMKSLGITPSDLGSIINGGAIDDKRLLSKLSDISLIYTTYKTLESERFADISDDMITLADMLKSDPDYLIGSDIYIDGFTSFTEPQYKLIEEMMRSASLTVFLTLPKEGHTRFEYTEVRSMRSRLVKIADRLGVDKKIRRPDGRDSARSPLLSELSDLLWRTDGEIDKDYLQNEAEISDTLRIFSASTPFVECEFLAADIKRRVMSGDKFSDFAVIARSAEGYTGILDLAFERAGIPSFFSRKRDISSFEAVKLINTAYAIVTRNYSREDVLTYLKCGLSGIDKKDRDLFELYSEKWKIDGSRFTQGDFEMNPRGYEPFNEDDIITLAKINEVRETLTSTLGEFRESVRRAKTVREHALALYEFLVKEDLETNLLQRSNTLAGLGRKRQAEENSKLWGVICSSLDLIVDTLGETVSDTESFQKLLGTVLASQSIGSIPSHVDEVTVGSADMIRLSDKKHVYLIGVNEGEFPRGASDNSYFTDRDRALLASFGLSAMPEAEIRNARELYCFTRAFTFAKKSVTLMYTTRSASLSALMPSEVIKRIRDLTGGAVKVKEIDSLSISERIFSPDDAFEMARYADKDELRAIRDALLLTGNSDVLEISEGNLRNENHSLSPDAAAIFIGDELYLSQSRLESFLKCPFSYFLKYNMKLNENECAELSSNVIGSFIHAILEDFFRESRRIGDISSLTDEDKRKIAEFASKRYIGENFGGGFGNERTKVSLTRLCRAAMPVIEGLCDEFSECSYRPVFFELPCNGKSGNADPIIYEEDESRRVVIGGKIDRVDTYKYGDEIFVRVVDYKTGHKMFSPSDLEEGINLQMFLYLKAVVDTDTPEFRKRIGALGEEKLVPAGVIYAKTSISDAKVKHSSDEDAMRAAIELSSRDGMVLEESHSLDSMNPRYTPLTYPETSKSAKYNNEKKYTRERWDEITDGIKNTVLEISKSIRSGNVSADPKEIKGGYACEFCKFGAICRNARKEKK